MRNNHDKENRIEIELKIEFNYENIASEISAITLIYLLLLAVRFSYERKFWKLV